MTNEEIREMMKSMEGPKSSFVNSRTKLLKTLHNIMINMNDENAYMTWIYIVPDEPTEDDFIDIACNDKDFEDVLNLFIRLFSEYKYAE